MVKTKKTKKTYHIEVTDTFGGEANYTWVKKFTYKASSFLGAIRMLAREHGSGWKDVGYCGECQQYNLKNACITCFITEMHY